MFGPTHPLDIAAVRRSGWLAVAGLDTASGYAELSRQYRLAAQALADNDPDAADVLDFLATITSLHLAVGDWNNPYRPGLWTVEGRTFVPEDLEESDIDFVRVLADEIPEARLHSRLVDLLWLKDSGRVRYKYGVDFVTTWSTASVTESAWFDLQTSIDRALDIGKRLGAPAAEPLEALVGRLIDVVMKESSSYFPVQVADLLLRHGLARDRAHEIAERLVSIAEQSPADHWRVRAFRAAAAAWFRRSDDSSGWATQVVAQVDDFVEEAESSQAAGGRGNGVAASLFENALQTFRSLPKQTRIELGIADRAKELAYKIREAGRASLSEMTAFTSDSIDLSDAVQEVVARVRDKEPGDALAAVAELSRFASSEKFKEDAEKLVAEHPLQSLFSVKHMSSDGRLIGTTTQDGSVYGLPAPVWRQMVQAYEWRVRLYAQGLIWPALAQLITEHRFAEGDFVAIANASAIVPKDRLRLYAKGLLAGCNLDFETALHLLVPQVENLVRFHLNQAGVATTRIDPLTHVESEVGLSALMELDEVLPIFGEDVVFEIRALMCGPIGPNLRNEVAHGLVSDSMAASVHSLYVWWFCFRLVYLLFWNGLRDAGSTDVPAAPEEQANSAGGSDSTAR